MFRKIKVAVIERGDHVFRFKQFEDALPPDAVAKWKDEVELWEQDSTKPNPFAVRVVCELYSSIHTIRNRN